MINKRFLEALIIMLIITIPLNGQNSVSISKKKAVSIDLSNLAKTALTGKSYQVNTNWLNYTAMVSPTESTLSISAEVASGQVPSGFKMFIEALPYKGLALGEHGLPTGKIQLEQIPRVIIDNIGTSFTGAGPEVGHQLVISFEVEDFSLIEPGLSFLFIEFTMK